MLNAAPGAKPRTVKAYIEELERTKEGRPEQVKEGLEVYLDLWKRTMANGVVSADDDVEAALEKIDRRGGLYASAEE
jgi:hypothetical protein